MILLLRSAILALLSTYAVAGPSDLGGGDSVLHSAKSDIELYLGQQVRFDLVEALQRLTPEQLPTVVPSDLNIRMLAALITTVTYRNYFQTAELPHLMEMDRRASATTELNKISPEDIKHLVEMGRDLSDTKIHSQLSPINFDVRAIQRSLRKPVDFLCLVYSMHLIQLGKTREEASRYSAALAQIANSL